MNRVVRKTLVVSCSALAGLAVLWLVAGLGLALVPAPEFAAAPIDLPSAAGPRPADLRWFGARDGVRLAARVTPGDAATTTLFLHGVLESSAAHEETARLLAEASGGRVVRLDLRGHGSSEGKRGDVAGLGRYDEDVAGVLAQLRAERPDGRLLLAGFSMGGGIALRALGRGVDVDGTVLFAPLLGTGAPTERRAAGPPDPNAPEPRMKVHVPRLLGLAMLNAVRIRGLNGLDTLLFNLRRDGRLETYTFRAMASMAPEDFRAVLSKDPRPLLCLVGRNDAAFRAEAYPEAMRAHRTARTVLLDGVSHEGATRSPLALEALRAWVATAVRR